MSGAKNPGPKGGNPLRGYLYGLKGPAQKEEIPQGDTSMALRDGPKRRKYEF